MRKKIKTYRLWERCRIKGQTKVTIVSTPTIIAAQEEAPLVLGISSSSVVPRNLSLRHSAGSCLDLSHWHDASCLEVIDKSAG